MSLLNNFDTYIEEIELIRAQNRVECDLYSIIAGIIRESKQGGEFSLRDVSARRKTEFSEIFMGDSGFPDFVLRTRDKSNDAAILGAIEVKYIDEDLDLEKHLEQLSGHIFSYKKVIYTNGLEWRFYDNRFKCGKEDIWRVNLGEINKKENKIKWDESGIQWKKLLLELDHINWN